jgi:hypothetical protein
MCFILDLDEKTKGGPIEHCVLAYLYAWLSNHINNDNMRTNNNHYLPSSFFTKGIILFKIMDSWSASVSNDTIRIG